MASVTFDKATRRFPSRERPAVDSLDLEIEDGEFMVLLGPSGCGKSTCLRMLAGLEAVDSGSVLIGVRDVTHLPPRDRDIAMVFQDYALLPHLSAADNMGFALKIARMSKVRARQRVDHAAAVLDLEQYLGRRPRTLAGGERQRVATGRVLVRDPRVYLMDEPLSNLDARLRAQTRTEIVRLQNHLGITTVYVTHDQTEAMAVGDRLAVLKDGVLQQVGTPKEVYAHPANTFVGGFVGSPAMNLFRLPLSADGARLGALDIPLTRATLRAAAAGGADEIVLGVRPEQFELLPPEDRETAGLDLVVETVEDTGAVVYLHATAWTGEGLAALVIRLPGRPAHGRGAVLRVAIRADAVHCFSASTGRRLPEDADTSPVS
ncbi:ATP-binding cassette domain-containing protein [Streptomyces sp. NBC_00201]|uniref:ABC transporter ATP-binding protein n=1 Tax=unclassified Streptomyces TaxID=2593676 RepID=UPI002259A711|nr:MULTISPECIES: ATP-binding cassette domain-containing protein [unclassified Streptomyces]MCX5250942.1 ATP-binding cassette domain-containing protein [Streptomyces sp. NBC_00201]MCX5291129.1 ATP-binding cassette domain-containing protein [Streptomyces sp. NBC_00183]